MTTKVAIKRYEDTSIRGARSGRRKSCNIRQITSHVRTRLRRQYPARKGLATPSTGVAERLNSFTPISQLGDPPPPPPFAPPIFPAPAHNKHTTFLAQHFSTARLIYGSQTDFVYIPRPNEASKDTPGDGTVPTKSPCLTLAPQTKRLARVKERPSCVRVFGSPPLSIFTLPPSPSARVTIFVKAVP